MRDLVAGSQARAGYLMGSDNQLRGQRVQLCQPARRDEGQQPKTELGEQGHHGRCQQQPAGKVCVSQCVPSRRSASQTCPWGAENPSAEQPWTLTGLTLTLNLRSNDPQKTALNRTSQSISTIFERISLYSSIFENKSS